MLNKLVLGMCFLGLTITTHASPIETQISIKNFEASYVNRGICSIAFDMVAHDFLENVEKIDFYYVLKTRKGELIEKGISTANDFNMVGGRTYGDFFIESEGACGGFGGVVDIPKAIVTYNDGTRPEDIVKTKKLIVDDFKPVKLNIGSSR